jgi:hypothetical protein
MGVFFKYESKKIIESETSQSVEIAQLKNNPNRGSRTLPFSIAKGGKNSGWIDFCPPPDAIRDLESKLIYYSNNSIIFFKYSNEYYTRLYCGININAECFLSDAVLCDHQIYSYPSLVKYIKWGKRLHDTYPFTFKSIFIGDTQFTNGLMGGNTCLDLLNKVGVTLDRLEDISDINYTLTSEFTSTLAYIEYVPLVKEKNTNNPPR